MSQRFCCTTDHWLAPGSLFDCARCGYRAAAMVTASGVTPVTNLADPKNA
jgi:hypothetical protein